jgi:hypothetical protein
MGFARGEWQDSGACKVRVLARVLNTIGWMAREKRPEMLMKSRN